jgi:hypothetical protein
MHMYLNAIMIAVETTPRIGVGRKCNVKRR